MRLIEHGTATNPGTARAPGSGCLWNAELSTPVGPVLAGVLEAPAGVGLALLEFVPGPRAGRGADAVLAATGAVSRDAAHPMHDTVAEQLAAYAEGGSGRFDLTLHLIGTAFQRSVWRELLAIPHAETVTYGQLADRLGSPGGSRAVGAANGANRIGVVVPCHRVVASDGSLGGYGGGLARKRRLLEIEGASLGETAPSLWA